jgi:BON domain
MKGEQMSDEDLTASVTDELSLDPKVDDAGIIDKALTRYADVDANDLTVTTYDNTVELEGTVGSWSEHDAAIAAAWAAPGVLSVKARLIVSD